MIGVLRSAVERIVADLLRFGFAAGRPLVCVGNVSLTLPDTSIVLAAGAGKTTGAVKRTRRFAYTNLIHRKRNLVPCAKCGAWNEIHTICGACYDVVRQETNRIKRQMLSFEPFASEPSEYAREVAVRYDDDETADRVDMWAGKRVVELQRKRPSWFCEDLTRRWNRADSLPPARARRPPTDAEGGE